MTPCYSPFPVQQYRIDDDDLCEARLIERHTKGGALWNLFWLSVPTIDKLPGAGKEWWRAYKPLRGCLGACIRDVQDDEVLYRKLLMSAASFLQWFERDKHTDYELYRLFGRPWVETVMIRAEDAMLRAAAVPRVYSDGKGIKIDYTSARTP